MNDDVISAKMEIVKKLKGQAIVLIDKKTAMWKISSEYTLIIDVTFPPELWAVKHDGKEYDWKKSFDVPNMTKAQIDVFAGDYLHACEALAFGEAGDKIDEDELKTSDEEEKKIIEMERREKAAEQIADEDKLAKLNAIMDGEADPVKTNDVKAHFTKETKKVHKTSAMIPADIRSKQITDLTPEDIITFLCPKASMQDAVMFLRLCQARGINPFLREAYLIKYKDGEPAQMVVARDYFARKAEEHPQYDGNENGIIIKREDNTLEERAGVFLLPGECLVGGWCNVYRKDRTRPTVSKVALHEYQQRRSDGTLNKFWNEKTGKPATMINKVAFTQGHRSAFPGELSGLYDRSEIDGEIIEAEYQEVGE